MYQVAKRDGQIAEFNIVKISEAISKAFAALGKQSHPSVIDMLALRVTSDFESKIKDDLITVEDIQDRLESLLGSSQIKITELYLSNEDIIDEYMDFEDVDLEDPKSILETLKENLDDFPEGYSEEYTINYAPIQFDQTDLLYVTTNDLHKKIIDEKLLDDPMFIEFFCELFETNYREKLKGKYQRSVISTRMLITGHFSVKFLRRL